MEKPHQLDHPPCLQCSHSKPNQVQSRLSLLSIGSYWQKSSPSAMTYSDSGLRDTLAFRLPSHKFDNSSLTNDPGVWGHEYVCHLPAEIGEAYQAVQSNHKGEADVIDLLERESINDIVPFVAEHDYSRVCNYMLSRVKFLVPPDDTNFLGACREIYRSHSRFPESIMINIKMSDKAGVKVDFESASNPNMKLQLAHLLVRHQLPYLSADLTEDEDLTD
ncbi:hypothetical protein MJO28_015811 [Puccinia striiformis f. sp. tritici]|uniref:Uncharacterized protein n=1 Tax=Puccinia striiformis f. sp. tritici TaxID=168172 RepID=A0ACC0DQU8_9BASI|nr:hypothetical protein MJO28_015811 [Puccinia striiformis f. sp. tritici]